MSSNVTSPSSTVAASQSAAIGSPSLFDHTPETSRTGSGTSQASAIASSRFNAVQDLVGDPFEHGMLRSEVVDLRPRGSGLLVGLALIHSVGERAVR